MPKVEQTLTITADNAAYSVDKMSPQIKQLISMMDEWRQKEADLTSDLLMVRGAIRDIQTNIYGLLMKELQDTLAKAKAMGLIQKEVNVSTAEAELTEDKKDELPQGE